MADSVPGLSPVKIAVRPESPLPQSMQEIPGLPQFFKSLGEAHRMSHDGTKMWILAGYDSHGHGRKRTRSPSTGSEEENWH
jgi:hypothetical protein